MLRVRKVLRHRFAETVVKRDLALLVRVYSPRSMDLGHEQELLDVEFILATARVLSPVQPPQRKLALGVTELAQLHTYIKCVW